MTQMTRYLDPTNDVAFKKVFGTEEHKPLLISFLNAILKRGEDEKITHLDFLPLEEMPIVEKGKRVIFDVKCKDKQGHEFIVEMQNRKMPEFFKRSQYYASHCYVSQIGKGTSYFELKPVVLIAVSNFQAFTEDEAPVSYHRILNVKTHANHLKDISYVFVELPKFIKTEDELETIEDKWLFFLKNAESLQDVPKSVVEQEIIEAYQALEQFKWEPEEYDAYVRANIAITDDYSRILAKYEEGKKEGFEEGERLGIEKGIEKVALKMLSDKTPISEVSKYTGLSEQEIQGLLDS